jgi:hypothetical protein
MLALGAGDGLHRKKTEAKQKSNRGGQKKKKVEALNDEADKQRRSRANAKEEVGQGRSEK